MTWPEMAFLGLLAAYSALSGSWQGVWLTGILAGLGGALAAFRRDSGALAELGPELTKIRDLYQRLANRPDPTRSAR